MRIIMVYPHACISPHRHPHDDNDTGRLKHILQQDSSRLCEVHLASVIHAPT